MSVVYVDIESTGLDPNVHEITEIGWAIDGVSDSIVLPHTLATFEQAALDVSQYHSRELWDMGRWCMPEDIRDLREKLQGVTLAGCNPHFDAMFLKRLFGGEVWHYRLLDVAAWIVRPGGRLVFVTCSLLDDEGAAQARIDLDHPPDRPSA